MPEEKFGTEGIEKVADFVVEIANDTDKANEDGHINLKDAPLFLDDLLKIPGVAKAIPKLPAEFLDLSETERTKIKQGIADKLNCSVEEVEEVAEKAINTLIDTSVVGKDIKELVIAIKALKALKKAQNAE